MQEITLFSLQQHVGPYESWPRESELLRGGGKTGTQVPGYVIEAQYHHERGFLLVTSWDCPYEEAQTFLLLTPELRVLSAKTIGAAYASIWLKSHEPLDSHSVLFHCSNDITIMATVTPQGTLALTVTSQ